MQPHKVAVGLVRASSDKQDKSTADQRAEIERWARAAGHDVLTVFEDNGVSGSVLDRPGLRALLTHVEAHRAGGVVVMWRRNRLARPDDPLDGLNIERRITKAGWAIHYLQGANLTGDTLVDGILGQVDFFQAGQYLQTLSVETLRGQAGRAAEGGMMCGRAPYGMVRVCVSAAGARREIARVEKYRRAPGDRVTFAPGDPAEVDVVRWIFNAFAGGAHSTVTASHELSARCPSPAGGRWSLESVRKIVTNPVYCGDLAWNRRTTAKFSSFSGGKIGKTRVPEGQKETRSRPEDVVWLRDHHEGIVDRLTWERANATLRARGGARGHERRAVHAYALSGLVVCSDCGQAMHVESRKEPLYMCSSPRVYGTCSYRAIRTGLLESVVLERLRETFLPARDVLEARVRELLGERQADTRAGETDSLRREVVALERRVTNAVTNLAMVSGKAAEALAKKIGEWQQRLAEVVARIAGLEAQRPRQGYSVSDTMAALDDLENVPSSPDRRRALFRNTVARVELDFRTERRAVRARHHVEGGRVFLPNLFARLAACLWAPGLSVAANHVETRGGLAHIVISREALTRRPA